MLQRGRALDGEEFPADLRERLQAAKVSPARATELCLSDLFQQEQLSVAAAGRREDLLVHFAMLLFPGAPRYATLARSIQRDVRTFFGSHAAALEEARSLMFSAGKPDIIQAGIELAATGCLGGMRDGNTFRFASSALDRLPPVLRLRVLCAGLLRGGVEAADFVDVKLDTPRLKFIQCMDASARLPIVTETTRVDLGRARVTVDRPDGMVLYLKGRFLPLDAPGREGQLAFDAKLLGAGLVNPDGKGPNLSKLRDLMRKHRIRQPGDAESKSLQAAGDSATSDASITEDP